MSYTQVVLKNFGGPEELELRTNEDLPEAKPGEVRIRVLVTSAAFTDVMIRKGMYPDVKEKPPFVPGYDLVGVVDALGPGVDAFAPGDRVADLTTIGAYSEYVCLTASALSTWSSPCIARSSASVVANLVSVEARSAARTAVLELAIEYLN